MHYVYHIRPKGVFKGKVGATENVPRRVELQQGALPGEYSILLETESLQDASDTEIYFQELYGYKKDKISYLELKTKIMKKTSKITKNYGETVGFEISKNKQWYSNYGMTPSEAIKEAQEKGITVGDRTFSAAFVNEKVIKLIQSSHWKGCYISARGWQTVLESLEQEEEEEDPFPNGRGMVSENELMIAREKNSKRQQNVCSDLEIGTHLSPDLDKMMLMQRHLQQKFPSTVNIGSKDQTLAEIAELAQRNWSAFTDEYCEFLDAIGGINNGIGNGAWKYWKKDHAVAHKLTLQDLSEEDLKELQMEVVDMLHFFMNFALLVGMTGSSLFNMYMAKNKENFDRQKRGY